MSLSINPVADFCQAHQITGAREPLFPALLFHAAQMKSDVPPVRHVALEVIDAYGDVTLHGPFARFMAHDCAWLVSANGIRHEDNLIESVATMHRARARINDVPAHALDKDFLALIPAFMKAFPGGTVEPLVPEPVALSEEEFLCGADSPDPWCNQSFEDYIEDIDTVFDPQTMVRVAEHYWFAESSDSVLLLYREEPPPEIAGEGVQSSELAGEGSYVAPPEVAAEGFNFSVVGYYNTPGAVCIQDEHQGQGLGAELILHTYLLVGTPPTEGLDEQMFSEAGLAAHRRAYELGRERGVFIEPARVKHVLSWP